MLGKFVKLSYFGQILSSPIKITLLLMKRLVIFSKSLTLFQCYICGGLVCFAGLVLLEYISGTTYLVIQTKDSFIAQDRNEHFEGG